MQYNEAMATKPARFRYIPHNEETLQAQLTSVERGHNSELGTFPDALWWAVVTVTTVGYGDIVPVTPVGRAFAYVLMIGGIGLFGALKANLASIMTRKEDHSSAAIASPIEEGQSMRDELTRLREQHAPD